MLQELAGPTVRKAESLSWWQKNRLSQDENKNCSQLFPGQSQGYIQCRKDPSGKGLAAAPSSALGDLNKHQGWDNTYWGCQKKKWLNTKWRRRSEWTSPLIMVPQISRLEEVMPSVAEVMPVGVPNFSFPTAVFLCCCDRGFILLCVQDSKSELLRSSYYKCLKREHQEGRQESCLSVTAEHSTPEVLPRQSSKRVQEWWAPQPLLRQMQPALLPAQKATAPINTTLFKAEKMGENSPNGTNDNQFFLKYFTLMIGGHEPYCCPHT